MSLRAQKLKGKKKKKKFIRFDFGKQDSFLEQMAYELGMRFCELE